MQENSLLETFIDSSPYSAPVDKKKLTFIFSALNNYRSLNNVDFKNLQILEVACGRGGITLSLSLIGCHVTAFDIDKESVSHLKNLIDQNEIRNIIVTIDDGYTFDDGNTYDIVIASEVFEHVLEPSKLAKNIRKRMKFNSHLIITTPNGFGPWEIKNRLSPFKNLKKWNFLRRLFNKPLYQEGSGGGHCQFFTKNQLEKLFSEYSLKLLKFAKSDSFLTIFPRFRKSALIGNLDIKLADYLPHWLSSGWYFVFELQSSNDDLHS